jgi:hypothetical protein
MIKNFYNNEYFEMKERIKMENEYFEMKQRIKMEKNTGI